MQPLLEGALAEAARATLRELAEVIRARPPAPAERLLWWANEGDEAELEAALDATLASLEAAEISLDQLGREGLAGTGWILGAIVDEADLGAIDEALAGAIDAAAVDDLPDVGVYLLARPGMRESIARLVARVAASPSPAVVALLARVPGPPAELAPRARDLAARARDVEAAAAVLAAGVALGDRELATTGLELAAQHGEASVERCRAGGLGLAGGAASIAHLYHRLYRATGDEYLRAIARACCAELVPRAIAANPTGVWRGLAGVGLVLQAALADEPSAWDRLVLADLAPAAVARSHRPPATDATRTNVDGLTATDLETSRATWWDAMFATLLRAPLSAAIEEPGWIVDLGCGVGHVGRSLLAHAPHASYLGVDLDRGRLVQAAHSLAEAGAHAGFVRADAMTLPLSTGAARAVTATLALQHVPAPERALAEAHRVLRSGGVLAVVEPDHLAVELAFGDDDLADVRHAFAALGERSAEAHRPGDLRIGRRLAELVATAGFIGVEVEPWPCPVFDQTVVVARFAAYLRRGVQNLARRARLSLAGDECQAAYRAIEALQMRHPPTARAHARRAIALFRCVARRG